MFESHDQIELDSSNITRGRSQLNGNNLMLHKSSDIDKCVQFLNQIQLRLEQCYETYTVV